MMVRPIVSSAQVIVHTEMSVFKILDSLTDLCTGPGVKDLRECTGTVEGEFYALQMRTEQMFVSTSLLPECPIRG